jgi:glucokinase
MGKPAVLGVDIGGSHITAALVDLDTRSIVQGSVKRKSIDSRGSKADLLAAWAEVIKEVFSFSDATAMRIGIAMPGPFDYENGICLIKDQDKFKCAYIKSTC